MIKQAQLMNARQLMAVAERVVRQRQAEAKNAASTVAPTTPGQIEEPIQ